MTVGFAAYAQLVSNNDASAMVNQNPVHRVGFDAESYLESDTSVVAREKSITPDEFNFAVRLNQPGDSYATVLNIVNTGNVDEILDEIQMTELDPQTAELVDYRISFDEEDYIGTSYNIGSIINRGSANRKQLFVTVEYKADAKNAGPLDLNLATRLVFEQ